MILRFTLKFAKYSAVFAAGVYIGAYAMNRLKSAGDDVTQHPDPTLLRREVLETTHQGGEE